jgi:uncharacterized protein YdeI (BOF family)
MKKTLVALLFVVSVMSFTACMSGKKSEDAQDTTSVQMDQPAAQSTTPTDTTQASDTTQMQ